MSNLKNIRKIKARDGSYFHNNFAKMREGEAGTVISADIDTVTCRLNGYAIIPIEEYYKLIGEPKSKITEISTRIKITNEQLLVEG